LEKILVTYGPRAAYHAALGLAQLARRAKDEGGIDSTAIDPHQLSDLPDVLPLYYQIADLLLSDLDQVKVRALSTTV
jgi:hypothetical protein